MARRLDNAEWHNLVRRMSHQRYCVGDHDDSVMSRYDLL